MICDWLQCCTCSQSYQQLLTQIWIQRHGILDKDEYRKCWEEMLGGKGGLSVSSRTWGTFPDTQSRLSMLAPSRGARGWWRTWTSELMCKEGETNVKRAGGLQAIQRDQRKPERWTWRLYWSPFLKPDRPGDEVCRALSYRQCFQQRTEAVPANKLKHPIWWRILERPWTSTIQDKLSLQVLLFVSVGKLHALSFSFSM